MRQASWELFARRIADVQHQARQCHLALRHLTGEATVVSTAQDGTVLVRVSAAAWEAALTEAAQAPPEPLGGPATSPNGYDDVHLFAHDNAPDTRATG